MQDQEEKKEEVKVEKEPEAKSQTPLAEEKENDVEKNWEKFRQKREEERKRLQEEEKGRKKAEKEAKLLREALQAQIHKTPEKEKEETDPWDVDAEYIRKDDFGKLVSKYVEEEKKKKEQEELPTLLKTQMPDFDEVCTQENADYLEYHHPEIAEGIKYMPDGIKKWSVVYRAIKKYIPNAKNISQDKKRLEENSHKPQSASSGGVAQMGHNKTLGAMSDDQKKANWERMQQIMRGAV